MGPMRSNTYILHLGALGGVANGGSIFNGHSPGIGCNALIRNSGGRARRASSLQALVKLYTTGAPLIHLQRLSRFSRFSSLQARVKLYLSLLLSFCIF